MTIHQLLKTLLARKGLILATVVVLYLLLGLLLLVVPPKYTATASVVVDSQSQDAVLGALSRMPISEGYVATQADIIASPRVARLVVDRLKLADNPSLRQAWMEDAEGRGDLTAWIGDVLLIGLKVRSGRESNVVEIDYSSPDPAFASAVANAFAQAYLQTSSDLKVNPALQSAKVFDTRIAELRTQLTAAQAKLADAQRQSGIVVTPERLDVENARLSDLSTQLALAQSERADASSRERGAAGNTGTSPDVIQNGVVQQLKTQIALQESQLKLLSGQLGPNHPQYIRAQEELDNLRKSLAEESTRVGESLSTANRVGASRVYQLQSAVDQQRQRIIDLAQQRDKLSVLQREVDNAQKAYDLVMERFSQTSIESQVAQPDVALLTPAVEPIEPSFPKVKLFAILTLLIGLLLGSGIALAYEIFNPMVHSAADISLQIGLPVFAIVPKNRKRRSRFLGRIMSMRRRRSYGSAY